MKMKRVCPSAFLALFVTMTLAGCSDIPACKEYYSSKGDSQAIYQIVDEFQKAIQEVSKRNNMVLLSQVRNIRESKDFLRMEAFSCRVQKEYGQGESVNILLKNQGVHAHCAAIALSPAAKT